MILSASKGNFQTRLIVIGFVFSFACGILELLIYSETAGTYSPILVHIGSAILVLMLTLVLFYEFKKAREQKELAQQRALNAVKREKETRRKFTQKLLNVQEEQCKRISLELHDSVGQDLLVVKNLISFGKKNKINVVENDKYFKSILNSTSRAIEEVRDISKTLHPVQLENLGLTQALKSLISKFEESIPINFTYGVDNIDGNLEQENEIHLYRIIQESLNNISKHSEADKVEINISKEKDMIIISIKDNGKGFDTNSVVNQSTGLGLNGIAERANLLNGNLKINSEPNKGTEIFISIKI
jgi:signal transduction histidine kinase